jgi:hypothetical protein
LPLEVVAKAARLRELALHATGGPAIVESLTDGVGSRLAGSDGSRAAERWALAELRKLGFENVHAEPLMEPRWTRGEESGEVVAPARQKLVLTALGGSAATPSGGLEAPVVMVENVAALQELLRRKPGAVRGAIVFYRQRMPRSRDGGGYGATVPIRYSGPFEAAKGGAAGVLIRTVGTSSGRLPHTGAMKVETGSKTLPAAALSGPDADLLERLAGRGPVTVRFRLGCATLPDREGANVVGEIRGSRAPEEIVLLGAHLDSWDLGTGAIDDGAGVGIVVEASRLIASLPGRPSRTIRVVLYANEENGSRGSLAYAKAHEAESDRHVAALEMDLGTDRVYKMSWLAGAEGQGALAEIAELLKPLGIAETANETDGGADVGRLRAFGVPLIELNQDASRYFDIHHSADDTFDKIDAENLAQAVAATAVVAYVAADMPGTFGRVPAGKRKVPEW